MHVLTSLVVFGSAWLLWRSGGTALLASVIYLLLPEGYRWSHGYQSEHLEILLLSIAFLTSLTQSTRTRIIGAVCAIGTLWTNMSALPYAILLLFMLTAFPKRSFRPLLSALITGVGLAGLCYFLAGEHYLENVWSNQVASIPFSPAVWIQAITSQGTTILLLEGAFILLALLGLMRFLQEESNPFPATQRAWIVLYGIASIGSAVYVIKGGTVDYIFALAGPTLALFAAHHLCEVFATLPGTNLTPSSDPTPNPPARFVLQTPAQGKGVVGILISCSRILLLVGMVVLLAWQPFRLMTSFRHQAAPDIDLPNQSEGRIVEFSDREVRSIETIINNLCKPGEVIWAPPFFAALTKHPIAMDLSETYLWFVRWIQSLSKPENDPGVEQMINGLTDALKKQTIRLLLLNSRSGQWGGLLIPDHQLGGIPIRTMDPRLDHLQTVLENNDHPIRISPESTDKLFFQGWNERLEIWVPKDQPALLPPAWLEGLQ
jgi:hypothetical protein